MSKDASRKDGISSWCKNCRKDSTRKWNSLNTNRARKKYTREYLQQREYTLLHRYGINLNDYEDILKSQNYSCAICKKEAKEMTYHLHVDHCHTTGKVRGLLCSPCNVFLGYARDNTEVFKEAIRYIER